MAQWATFAGVVGIILVLLLALARASATVLSDPASVTDVSTESVDYPTRTEVGETTESPEGTTTDPVDESVRSFDAETPPQQSDNRMSRGMPPLSTPALLANVAFSQGLFAVLLVVMAWVTEVPAWAFGLSAEQFTVGAVGTGVAVGGVFYGLNEAAAAVGRRRGMATPTELREALAPETVAGWAVLLFVVLPIIAGFEELLFRGALIGVMHAGFGVPLWILAVGSSVAFGLGHGAQGRLGILVTGLLGIGLAAVFILTGSLLVVIVAHYVINAAEFVVHEGLERT